jgi:hypothetical protein
MQKRMEAINIRTLDDGFIEISSDDYGEGQQQISIPVEQIDTVIKWLQEAKAELQNTK